MPDMGLTHTLQKLAKTSSKVQSDRGSAAFGLDMPTVVRDWMRTKKVHVRGGVEQVTLLLEMPFKGRLYEALMRKRIATVVMPCHHTPALIIDYR